MHGAKRSRRYGAKRTSRWQRLGHHRGEGMKRTDCVLCAAQWKPLAENPLPVVLFLDEAELQHVHLDGISISKDVCGDTGAYITARSVGYRTAIDTRHRCSFRDPVLGKQEARKHARCTRLDFLVTKQRHINSLLDDRVSVWKMTFPVITVLLL